MECTVKRPLRDFLNVNLMWDEFLSFHGSSCSQDKTFEMLRRWERKKIEEMLERNDLKKLEK